MNCVAKAILVSFALLALNLAHAERFPSDSGAIDVTDPFFGALPNDGIDDTLAIQRVFDLISSRGQIVFFPAGQYDLSGEIFLRKTAFATQAEALSFSGWSVQTEGTRTFLRASAGNSNPDLAGKIRFDFDAIVAGRVLRMTHRVPSATQNGFYFRLNGGAWRTSIRPFNGNIGWRDNEVVAGDLALRTGSNTLEIAARDVGFEIDAFGLEYLGNYLNNVIIEGESVGSTSLKLRSNLLKPDGMPFDGAIIRWEPGVEQFFRTAVRDLTLDVGTGNPLADGLKFHGNNQSTVANVRFLGLNGSGDVALDLAHTDAIGPILVRDISVQGFAVGIHSAWQNASRTFDSIVLRNQRTFGWVNEAASTIWVRGLDSENAVTAFHNNSWRLPGDGQGRVALIDARLAGLAGASAVPAIETLGLMYARNVQTNGYGKAVLNQNQQPFRAYRGQAGIERGLIQEWWSTGANPGEGGGMTRLFDAPGVTPDTLLGLPIAKSPIPRLDPLNAWDGPHRHIIEVTPGVFSGRPDDAIDDTLSLQAAVDSGAGTVYLPNGRWILNGTLILRANVQRFLGTEAEITASTFSTRGVIVVGATGPSPLFIERFANFGFAGNEPRFEHASSRTVVFNDLTGLYYRATVAAPGDVFINDTVGNAIEFKGGQNVWARQLNIEEDTTQVGATASARLVNDGAKVWVLGFKTEQSGVIAKTTGGGHTEIIGNLQLNTFGSGTAQYLVENAALSVAINVKPYPEAGTSYGTVIETRGAETRTGLIASAGYVGFSRDQLWALKQEWLMDSDDAAASYVGSWASSAGFPRGHIGSNFRFASVGANQARFAPTLPQGGRFQVYARWIGDWGGQDHSGHASNARISVTHLNGVQNLLVDQRVYSDGWYNLGEFDFASTGGMVQLDAAGANGKVNIDAVRFVRVVDPVFANGFEANLN